MPRTVLLAVDLNDAQKTKAEVPELADALEVTFLSLDRLRGRSDLDRAYATPRAKIDRRFEAALHQIRFAVYCSDLGRIGYTSRIV